MSLDLVLCDELGEDTFWASEHLTLSLLASRPRSHFLNSRIIQSSVSYLFGVQVLLTSCPKCVEDRYKDQSDNRSVSSRRSTRSSRSLSRGRRAPSRGKDRECPFGESGKYHYIDLSSLSRNCKAIIVSLCVRTSDNQGYCHVHSNIRLAKKKVGLGGRRLHADSDFHRSYLIICRDGNRS